MITGASSGLGEALSHVFYSCGCRLILIARRGAELERVKNTLLEKHCVCSSYSILSYIMHIYSHALY